jgi:hypothetical protein
VSYKGTGVLKKEKRKYLRIKKEKPYDGGMGRAI